MLAAKSSLCLVDIVIRLKLRLFDGENLHVTKVLAGIGRSKIEANPNENDFFAYNTIFLDSFVLIVGPADCHT